MALKRLSPTFGHRVKPRGAQGRILYVEDDDANWRVTHRCLRDKYSLAHARNSQEAMDRVINQDFDLILLDIELAGSHHDGIGICRILRGTDPMPWGLTRPAWLDDPVPIVFMTAYTSRYPREELLRQGANEVVTKPVDYTRLLLVSSRLIVSALRGSNGPTAQGA